MFGIKGPVVYKVTKYDCPVIFHDFILTQEEGAIVEKRVRGLTLDEFLSYGPQRDPSNVEKPLFRKTKDWGIYEWKVEKDDHFCTLQDAFHGVKHSAGFNIEPKFDDNLAAYKKDELAHALFQPDAAQSILKLQTTYPATYFTVLYFIYKENFVLGTMDEIVDWGKVNKDRWIEIGQ
ncbi:hypothetical protein LguiA_029610 [Lonicera macranthoides]